MPQSWEIGTDVLTSLPKEGMLRIFFNRKNPTASAGSEPAILEIVVTSRIAVNAPIIYTHPVQLIFTPTCI
jgi:hypothetical protein